MGFGVPTNAVYTSTVNPPPDTAPPSDNYQIEIKSTSPQVAANPTIDPGAGYGKSATTRYGVPDKPVETAKNEEIYQNSTTSVDTLSQNYQGFTSNILDDLSTNAILAGFQSVAQDWEKQKALDEEERKAALDNALNIASLALFFLPIPKSIPKLK